MVTNTKGMEAVNRQLLENQTFLHHENQKLQDDVTRLSWQLENLRKSTVTPEVYDALKHEKVAIETLNQTLKDKIKKLKTVPPPLTPQEIGQEALEKEELANTIQTLETLLEKILHADKLEIKPPENNLVKTVETLTKKLDEQERKNEDASETIRKLRHDDEKYVLRDRINDMKQLITDLEVENTKLKFESEQLVEDVENYKKQLNESVEEVKQSAKKCYKLEDERDKFKDVISQLENEKIKLKKEMIEEMNEANRAKRVSVDTEIALQHISEAYESKRQEVMTLKKQLEEAEKIIQSFKRQFGLTN